MKRRGVRRRLIGLLVLGVIMVAANALGWLAPVEAAFTVVTKPLQSSVGRLGNTASGWFDVVGSARNLNNENLRLKDEVSSLRQQLSKEAELKAQNDELRKQLGVGGLRPDRLIAAEVIGYQPDNFRQFITIGRGQKDGVKPGMAVVEQGTLIGTIQDVGPTTSKVFLVSDPNFRVAVLDQNSPARATGTIHGQLGNGLVMDKIAQTDPVAPGDTIVTSGLGGEIEKGLIVGRIQSIDKKDNGVFQTAQVTTDVQFSRLEVVYVIARPQ